MGQSVHCEDPVVAAYEPGAHEVQVVDMVALAKVPNGHAAQDKKVFSVARCHSLTQQSLLFTNTSKLFRLDHNNFKEGRASTSKRAPKTWCFCNLQQDAYRGRWTPMWQP
jgi:hypothetical protein